MSKAQSHLQALSCKVYTNETWQLFKVTYSELEKL